MAEFQINRQSKATRLKEKEKKDDGIWFLGLLRRLETNLANVFAKSGNVNIDDIQLGYAEKTP